ncbi:MAG: M23 family metallopeptidase [Bdellovibrionales bacterium]|nr:M23 family metallopeptidase [Bdellovibrionales bacterium]
MCIRTLKFILLSTALSLTACSSLRVGGGYPSFGSSFRTSSDYASDSLRAPASASKSYAPRGDFKLFWPVNEIRLSRGFKESHGRPHQGLDLGGAMGAPILAAHEGVVIYTGRDFRGFGNMVLIEYDRRWATLYGHLSQIGVREGQTVLPGDVIGKMGRTGRASGVHLHFELMKNRLPVDPLPYLNQAGQIAGR